MNRIQDIIKDYDPSDSSEEEYKAIFLKFFEEFGEDIFSRENITGHMTASAWIVNSTREKVLMIHHNLYNSWGWVGGHADGDKDLLYVATKETKEETGLTDNNFKPLLETPISIEFLNVGDHMKKGILVPRHNHYNVTYLFEADEEAIIRIQEEENSNVAWVLKEDINKKVNEEHMRPIYNKIMKKASEFNKA